ncbi:MAG: hypothetical protein M1827_005174 [Pycnora praestabilis]|nr:MAG: hypothetical protein M1827_005174 [Pycnora praestabilis]
MSGRLSEHRAAFDLIASSTASLKIVIAGNHDITLDEGFYAEHWREKHGAKGELQEGLEEWLVERGLRTEEGAKKEDVVKCREVWCGEEARRNGIVYLEEGVRTFEVANGAKFTIYTSPHQPFFQNWAFNYHAHTTDRFNPCPPNPTPIHPSSSTSAPQTFTPQHPPPNSIPSHPAIDILLTHGPPSILIPSLSSTTSGLDVGCPHLARAVRRARPRLHVFGHIHEGYGMRRVRWTDRPGALESWGGGGGGGGGGQVQKGEGDDSPQGVMEAVEAVNEIEGVPMGPGDGEERGEWGRYVDLSCSGAGAGAERSRAEADSSAGNGKEHRKREGEFGRETVFVNASCVDVHYEMVNRPWLLDLELPAVAAAAAAAAT